MLAVAQITIRDDTDVAVSAAAPASPAQDMLWLDTSVTPHRLKRWSGSAWVECGADVDLSAYYTKTEINTRFEQTDEAVLAKASQETVDEMGQRVAAAEGQLKTTAEGVEALAARQDETESKQARLALDVDGLSLRFTSQEARQGDLEDDLDTVRANLDSYFTFSSEGYLEVGKSGMKSRFSADRLGFWEGVEEVAYVGNREFNSARIRARELFFLGPLQMQVLADGKIRAALAE